MIFRAFADSEFTGVHFGFSTQALAWAHFEIYTGEIMHTRAPAFYSSLRVLAPPAGKG